MCNEDFGLRQDIHGGRKVSTLKTGDGKTCFLTMSYECKEKASLLIGYGMGTGVGNTDTFDPPLDMDADIERINPVLIVEFINPDSIDAMIDQLKNVKDTLAGYEK
ncbi:MAG: hypothetical protein ACRDD7_02895 [Peptostreptococcaceae bacterium]